MAVLRLSVTDACNQRCQYCRPARETRLHERRPELAASELVRLAALIHEAVGLEKIRLTGGEPLLRPDVVSLVAALRRALPQAELCLTTNGAFLADCARPLREAGLGRLNVSLDTPDPAAYAALTRGGDVGAVLRGIEAARRAGFAKLKLNAVLLRSTLPTLPALVECAARLETELRFIELMPLGVAAGLHRLEYVSAAQAREALAHAFGPLETLERGGLADRLALIAGGRRAMVGFIRSVSEPFCEGCNRLRLDSRGRLYACLRHPDFLELGRGLDGGEVVRRAKRVLDSKVPPESLWPGRLMASIGG